MVEGAESGQLPEGSILRAPDVRISPSIWGAPRDGPNRGNAKTRLNIIDTLLKGKTWVQLTRWGRQHAVRTLVCGIAKQLLAAIAVCLAIIVKCGLFTYLWVIALPLGFAAVVTM